LRSGLGRRHVLRGPGASSPQSATQISREGRSDPPLATGTAAASRSAPKLVQDAPEDDVLAIEAPGRARTR